MLLRTPYDIRKARTQGWRILVASRGEETQYHIAGSEDELRREGYGAEWAIRPYDPFDRDWPL